MFPNFTSYYKKRHEFTKVQRSSDFKHCKLLQNNISYMKYHVDFKKFEDLANLPIRNCFKNSIFFENDTDLFEYRD